MLDPRHTVYGVSGVTQIPLVEDRARIALNTLASRSLAHSRPSLMPQIITQPADLSLDGVESDDDRPPRPVRSSPRVQFLPAPAIRFLQGGSAASSNQDIGNAIERPPSADSVASDASNPSSENAGPVFKTLAGRLSFWSRAATRTHASTPVAEETPLVPVPMSLNEEQRVLDEIMQEGKEAPDGAIESILASTAPAPETAEERHSELETKVVRETIREFTKGDMYFAYNFGEIRQVWPNHLNLTDMRPRPHSFIATQTRTCVKITETT